MCAVRVHKYSASKQLFGALDLAGGAHDERDAQLYLGIFNTCGGASFAEIAQPHPLRDTSDFIS